MLLGKLFVEWLQDETVRPSPVGEQLHSILAVEWHVHCLVLPSPTIDCSAWLTLAAN